MKRDLKEAILSIETTQSDGQRTHRTRNQDFDECFWAFAVLKGEC